MARALGFGEMKANKFRRMLERELGYEVDRNPGGSHRRMLAPGRPPITFAFHDGDTVGPALVRDILVKQVGLTIDEAREVYRNG